MAAPAPETTRYLRDMTAEAEPGPPASVVAPTYNARALTRGGVSAAIVLDEQVYTLRITRAGKLILTK